MLQIIKDIMIRNKTLFEYMNGSTQDRQKAIEHFNNNEKVRAFLISLKTGGYGINLTAADTGIVPGQRSYAWKSGYRPLAVKSVKLKKKWSTSTD